MALFETYPDREQQNLDQTEGHAFRESSQIFLLCKILEATQESEINVSSVVDPQKQSSLKRTERICQSLRFNFRGTRLTRGLIPYK